MEKFDLSLILICLLVIVLLFKRNIIETFQRMNYIQLHNYLDQSYNNRIYDTNYIYPYRKYIPETTETPTVSQTGRVGYDADYIVDNIVSSYDGFYGNEDRLVGYLASEDTTNNDIYKLYEIYDHRTGRPGYAYKATKEPTNRDPVLINIDQKSYSGDYLYNGDIVNITYEKKPYVVTLYSIKSTGIGTRYPSQDYRSGMQEYALLEPINPGIIVDENDKYYILYKQEIDPRRQLNNYYIKDKRGIIIEIDTNNKTLYEGDTVLIPGKEKYGEYSVKELDRY